MVLVLVVIAYLVMLGVLFWVYQSYRKRVARPRRLSQVLGLGALVAVLTFTAVISKSYAGGCDAPALVVMDQPSSVVADGGDVDLTHVQQCVDSSSLQVGIAMLVQLVVLVIVVGWALRLIKQRRGPDKPYEPMYPQAFDDSDD